MLELADRSAGALQAVLEAARDELENALLSGTDAVSACAGLSATCDQIVISLVPEPGALDGISLVATGGWGRREMCPQSDLDLLILSADETRAAELADSMLYVMWDARIKVGHAVRHPSAIEELARGDVKTATALLDARLIAGDDELFAKLVTARRRAIAPGGDPSRFVRQLTDERDRRHRRFGDSIYLLEPNLKQGIGGLRDLATALWVAQVRFGRVDARGLVRSGQLTRRQADVLEASRDFLLRVRSLIHGRTKRATDQLSFELQEAIGPVLYPDAKPSAHKPAVAPAVEALMGDYYLHASSVTQVMTQLFEAALAPKNRRPTVVRVDSSFCLFGGKLSVSSADVFRQRPSEMVRTFRVARQLEVPIHWHTRELIAERGLASSLDLTANREACQAFLEALTDLGDRRSLTLLEEMHRVGLVAAVIPEFGLCTGRVQHDLYHVYTVDQHQLHAVNMLKKIARGELEDFTLATSIFGELAQTNVLFLATLLHDVGKPLGKGHSESGAKIARAAAIRFGLSSEDADRTALLVRHHLTMSHVSQRRDLSDPEVIARFAGHVGDITTLRELLLLTLVDTAMTAPGNLSTWKKQLLLELYSRTRTHFLGDLGDGDVPSAAARTRKRTIALLRENGRDSAAKLAADVDEHVASALTARQLARVLTLVENLAASETGIATSVRAFPLKGHSEISLVARDRPGLLADVTGALAVSGISVEAAVIGTVTAAGGELATDLFFVRRADGEAVTPSDSRWQRFQSELESLGEGDLASKLGKAQRDPLGERVTPEVLTTVEFADQASKHYDVLEVFTQDRVGLLSDIAGTLSAAGVDIHLAKISTEGERATDAFYVLEAGSGEHLSRERQAAVREALLELLG